VLELNDHLSAHLPKDKTFDWLLNVEGKVHRAVKNRRTVEFEIGGRRYFIKIHRGVGWREILKNVTYGRAPIMSAENEWRAIDQLRQLGIPSLTLAGIGKRGSPPAWLESFVITEALDGMISLEDLTHDWRGVGDPQRIRLKRAFIKRLAEIARVMHSAGLNHRDFYLCHFLVRDRVWTAWNPAEPLELFIIDLHRVQIRERVPERWLVKDLGGLLFSALDAGLTRRDLLRFVKIYRQRSVREVLEDEALFWAKVWENAVHLYEPFHGRPVPLRLK